MSIGESWGRIEAWLRVSASEALSELEGPATRESLEKASAIVGELPEDYRALVQIHDGVVAPQYGLGIFQGFVLHSVEGALRARDVMLDAWRQNAAQIDVDGAMSPDPGVRQAWWHERWLPIAVSADDSRTLIFLDLDPAPGGRRGQLVRHVVDMDKLPIIAASVAEWVERAADAMEQGQVAVERDGDLISLVWP